MPYPAYVPTRLVSIGGAVGIENAQLLMVKVVIRSTKSLVWQATGYRFERVGYEGTSELGQEIVIQLPRTDVQGWRDSATNQLIDVSAAGSYTHRYTAEVSFTDDNGVTRGSPISLGPFTVPAGSGTMDLDNAITVGTVAGDQVLIPNTWGQAITDAAAIAADAQAQIGQMNSLLDQYGAFGELVYVDAGTNLNYPRPNTQKKVKWFYQANPGQRPANMRLGDYADRTSIEAKAFEFNQIPGYGGDYDLTSLAALSANAVASPLPDISGYGRDLAQVSGTSVTSAPVYEPAGFGSNSPAVYFPSRSALAWNPGPTITTPPNLLVTGVARFRDVGTAANETLNTFGGQGAGRFSVGRVGAYAADGTNAQKMQIATNDGTGVIQSAVGDFRGRLRIIALWTPTRQRLWVNGVLVIDNTTTATPLVELASFRLGIVTTTSDTGLVRAMVDGRVRKFVWAALPDSAWLTATQLGNINTKLATLAA
jgi:hypothetical protein